MVAFDGDKPRFGSSCNDQRIASKTKFIENRIVKVNEI
jgi:hypothetical protein